jgi:hypothetical protein
MRVFAQRTKELVGNMFLITGLFAALVLAMCL